jgi:heptosyltransferase-2
VALHPGSGSERKNWPEAQWAELLQLLVSTTALSLLLVGGEAEGDRLQRLAGPLPAERVKTAQNLTLVTLGQRLQECLGFIGHDSGIAHLAAALGLPGLVLWRESVEAVWRPRSPRMKILNASGNLDALEVIREFLCLAEVKGQISRDDKKDQGQLTSPSNA